MVQPQQQQKSQTIELVPVSQLEDWAQLVFEGIEKFNRLQSWVFEDKCGFVDNCTRDKKEYGRRRCIKT